MEETLGEKTENKIETKNSVTKKKVRVVKKIVKKKIIKKVPKRNVNSVASNCDDSGKVTNPNPSFKEIEKVNVDIDGLKEAESVKEVVVSCMEVDENKISGLVTSSSLLGDDKVQNKLCDSDRNGIKLQDCDLNGIELQDIDRNRIELRDGDRNRIEFQDGDSKQIELQDGDQKRIEFGDVDQNIIELQDGDQSRIGSQANDQNKTALVYGSDNQMELQDSNLNRIGLLNYDQNGTSLLDGSENQMELQDSDHNRIGLQNNGSENRVESQDSNQNQIELVDREHDATNTMNVEEHDGDEGVKEQKNPETDDVKSQEASSESGVPSGKTVASTLHMRPIRKIFVHGLGQETKEEDIRKVFEQVGEVAEVKIVRNLRSGKNRGFGFITFASAELANMALTKYQNVEICGRPCHTSAIEGIDTILLNNIDKKWNKENVIELLQKIRIKNVDEVLVVPDPNNAGLNCGFAYLEFETKRDAQMAYYQLQNEIISGKHSNIKISWSSPNIDPVEEETNNNKSVYAENIPLSWDEKEVNDHFKMFGEIESIALAKNLWTAKRNDFAFINYKTCEAALSCVEALTCNNGPKGNMKVSLAKSIPKVKANKIVTDTTVTEVSQSYQNANRSRKSQNQQHNTYQSRQPQQNLSFLGVYKPPQKPKIMIGKHVDSRKDSASSTTDELVQLLREQASWKQGGPSSTAGMSIVHRQPHIGGKQPFTELVTGSKSLHHHDPRAYHQSHLQIPHVINHRPIANVTPFPLYDQQRVHYASGSVNFAKPDPRHIQTRDRTTYPGSSNVYRRTH